MVSIKTTKRNDVKEEEGRPNANTRAYNKDLLTQAIELTIFFLSALGAITIMFTIYFTEGDIQLFFFLMEDLFHAFMSMVISPMLTVLNNPDLRKHDLELYRGILLNCIF